MGRKSKIDRLPQAIRESLILWLSDPAWTRQDATDALNELLDVQGHPAGDDRPAVDSVNRYAQKFSALLQKQRERHEVAATWIGQFGRLPEGQLGQLIIQMVHGIAFEAGLKLGDAEMQAEDMPALVRMLKDLATTVERTERASTLNSQRELVLRQEVAAEFISKAQAAATGAGNEAVTITSLRDMAREIYGV